MKRFWYFLALTLAIILTVSGLITITVRARLLNEQLYYTALEKSGIYPAVTTIIEDKTTQGLITLQKGLVFRIGFDADEANIDTFVDRVLVAVLGSLIDNQTGKFVHDVFENLEIQRLMQELVEQRIAKDLAWLRGEREAREIFEYIPKPEQIEAFRDSSLNEIVAQLALESTGLNNLPPCVSQAEAQTNLNLALSGQVRNVTCTNEDIQPLIDARLDAVLPDRVINLVEAGIENRVDAFGIQPVIDGIYEISLLTAQFKQTALQLREYVQVSLNLAYLQLLLGFVFVVVAMIVNRNRKWLTLVYAYFVSGISILTLSAIYYFIIGPLAASQLPLEGLVEGISLLSAEENYALTQSFYTIFRYILIDVVRYTFLVGAMLTLATIIPLIILKAGNGTYIKQVKTDFGKIRKRLGRK